MQFMKKKKKFIQLKHCYSLPYVIGWMHLGFGHIFLFFLKMSLCAFGNVSDVLQRPKGNWENHQQIQNN